MVEKVQKKRDQMEATSEEESRVNEISESEDESRVNKIPESESSDSEGLDSEGLDSESLAREILELEKQDKQSDFSGSEPYSAVLQPFGPPNSRASDNLSEDSRILRPNTHIATLMVPNRGFGGPGTKRERKQLIRKIVPWRRNVREVDLEEGSNCDVHTARTPPSHYEKAASDSTIPSRSVSPGSPSHRNY